MKAMAESRRMVQAGMEHETNSPMSTGAKKVVKAAVPVTDKRKYNAGWYRSHAPVPKWDRGFLYPSADFL